MSFERLVDKKIKDAMSSGEFDNLPGKGKPLDLSEYFATPEDLRLTYSVLKNAGVVPEEVELLKEIDSLKEELRRCSTEDCRKRLRSEISDRTLKYNLLVERCRRNAASDRA